MAIENEKIVSIREMLGVNQAIDHRINAPGTFVWTKNYYAKRRGVLNQRPGSLIVSYTLVFPTSNDSSSVNLGGNVKNVSSAALVTHNAATETMSWNQCMDNHVQNTALRPNDVTMVTTNNPRPKRGQVMLPSNDPVGGVGGNGGNTSSSSKLTNIGFVIPNFGQNIPNSTPTTPSQYSGGHRVAELCRIYFDEAGNRLTMGVINSESPLGDQVFYINPAGQMKVIGVAQGLITSANATWQMLNYHTVGDPGDTQSDAGKLGWFGIMTNRLDPPLVITGGASIQSTFPNVISSSYTSTLPEHSQLTPTLAQYKIQTAETANSYNTAIVTAVQSMCFYNSQLILGGYCLWNAATGVYTDRTNRVAFCDPGKPYSISSFSDSTYDLPVGDNVNEPITAVCPTSVSNDIDGITSQLVIFTGRKIRMFAGMPPVSGSNSPSNFTAINTDDVGCEAPKTIQRTPHGIVFLGTDGYVRLLGRDGRSQIISYALDDQFFGMNPRIQQGACGLYRMGWYYLSYSSGAAGQPQQIHLANSRKKATTNSYRNDLQIWADLRFMSPMAGPEQDYGVKWYGPHNHLYGSCFAYCQGPEDNNNVFMGWDHTAAVSEILLPELNTDPRHDDPSKTLNIDNDNLIGELDFGNAHVEKEITAFSLGVRTDNPVIITSTIIPFSGTAQADQGSTQQFLVKPAGGSWGVNTTYWASENSFVQIAHRPAMSIRGRSFQADFKATAPYIVTTGTNDKLDFTSNGSAFTATVAAGTYSPSNDGLATNYNLNVSSLVAAIQAAINAVSATWTVGYDIASNSFNFTYKGAGTGVMKWLTGANTATNIGPTIGFAKTADSAAVANGTQLYSNTTPVPGGAAANVQFSDIEFRYSPVPRLP